jgi:hypothetical protein
MLWVRRSGGRMGVARRGHAGGRHPRAGVLTLGRAVRKASACVETHDLREVGHHIDRGAKIQAWRQRS